MLLAGRRRQRRVGVHAGLTRAGYSAAGDRTMPNLTRVAAVNASSADAFPLGVVADGERLHLETARGAARLVLPSTPMGRFARIEVSIHPIDERRSRGFVD